jgi:hypothetical protein
MKTFLTVVAAVVTGMAIVGGALAGCSWWLYSGSVELETVGDAATFDESAECVLRYGNARAGRPFTVRLNDDRVDACFPPQRAATQRALIACFNDYERAHRGHTYWPEDNMRGCTWDGLILPELEGVTFGPIVAVPAPPRAGRRVLVKVGVSPDDDATEIVHAAVGSGDLEVELSVDEDFTKTPLSMEWGLEEDGTIHVDSTVPGSASGKRLTLTLKTAPNDATMSTSFPIAR